MNETEILATVRQLARDLRELTPDAIDKSEAAKLLRSERGGLGGPLVQWLSGEQNKKRKLIITAIVKRVVRAGYQQKPDTAASSELEMLCNRLAPASVACITSQSTDRLSIAHIAKHLDVDQKTVRRFAKEGLLTLHKVEGKQRGMYAIHSEIDWNVLTERRDK